MFCLVLSENIGTLSHLILLLKNVLELCLLILHDITNYHLYKAYGSIQVCSNQNLYSLGDAIRMFKKCGGWFSFSISKFQGCHDPDRVNTYYQCYANLSLENLTVFLLKNYQSMDPQSKSSKECPYSHCKICYYDLSSVSSEIWLRYKR